MNLLTIDSPTHDFFARYCAGHGERCVTACDQGYSSINGLVTCFASQLKRFGTCTPNHCTSIKAIAYSFPVISPSAGQQVQTTGLLFPYKCKDGFFPFGAHECQPTGAISGGECKAQGAVGSLRKIDVPSKLRTHSTPFGITMLTFPIRNLGSESIQLKEIKTSDRSWATAYITSPTEVALPAIAAQSSRQVILKMTPSAVCCGFSREYTLVITVTSDDLDAGRKESKVEVTLHLFKATVILFTLPDAFTLVDLKPRQKVKQSMVLYNVYSETLKWTITNCKETAWMSFDMCSGP